MSKIHLPPGSGGGAKETEVISVCVSSTGGDSLEITITDPGFCLHSPNGYFQAPDLPSGPVSPQKLTLYPAVPSGTAFLAYYDSTTPGLFFFVIKIQECPCDSDSEDS
jgi:hypothetical protein